MKRTALASALFASAALVHAQSPDDWPQWRGPDASGVAPGSAPTRWSDGENVRWKVELPGRGMSTPIILGERLFLTTAVPTDPDADTRSTEAEEEGGRGRGRRDMVPTEQSFEVWCLDRKTGKTLWKHVATTATPHEGYHRSYGSYASASPVTDGERLYVSFGSQGLYAYDLDGKLLWERDLGVRLEMRNAFGEGLSPVLAGDALIQVCDQEGDSFVVALERATGKELWRRGRDERSAWATPLVTTVEGKTQIITSATNRVRAYDLEGEVVWAVGGLGANAIPAVARCNDTVITMSGYREANIVAVRLGGKGDLTGSDSVAWTSTKGCAYTASPVLHDALYYTVTDRGFISCFDALSGDAHYVEERLPRGSALKSSPVAAGGFLYVPTEAGDVHVVRLGPKLEVEATNTLEDQVFVASPAVAHGDLFLRSLSHLFCISNGE